METLFKFYVLPVETDGDAGSKGIFSGESESSPLETISIDVLPLEDGGDAGSKGEFIIAEHN